MMVHQKEHRFRSEEHIKGEIRIVKRFEFISFHSYMQLFIIYGGEDNESRPRKKRYRTNTGRTEGRKDGTDNGGQARKHGPTAHRAGSTCTL